MKKIILIIAIGVTTAMAFFNASAGRVKMEVEIPNIELDVPDFGNKKSNSTSKQDYSKYANIERLNLAVVAVSNDGQYVASSRKILNLKTGKVVNLNRKFDRLYKGKFSWDSQTYITYEDRDLNYWGQDVINIWDTNTGKLKHSIKGSHVVFYPNGKYFLYRSINTDWKKEKMIISDIEGNKKITTLPSYATNGIFSPDGKLYAVLNKDYVKIWETSNFGLIMSTSGVGKQLFYRFAFSSDGKLAFFNRKKYTVDIIDTNTRNITEIPKIYDCSKLIFSSNDKLIIHNSPIDSYLYVWDLNKKYFIWGIKKNVHDFTVAPVSKLVLYNDYDDNLHIKLLYSAMYSDIINYKKFHFYTDNILIDKKETFIVMTDSPNSLKVDIVPYNINIAKKVYEKIDKKDYMTLYEFAKKFYYKLDIVQQAYSDIYKTIKDANSIEVYDWYVQNLKYDKGYRWYQQNFGGLASSEMKDIEDKLYKLRQEKFAKEYEKVKKDNNLAIYENYAYNHTYPKAENLVDVVNAMHKLAFEKAKEINTVEAYNTFIYAYPFADEIEEANNLAYDIEKEHYTDIGLMGFFNKDEKMNKQARKLLIKAKKILDETFSSGDIVGKIDIGAYMVVDRMYRLAQNEFGDTDAVLTLMESDQLKMFKKKLAEKLKKREYGRKRVISKNPEDEIELRSELTQYVFTNAPGIDKKMKAFYESENKKAKEFIRNSKDKILKEYDAKTKKVSEKKSAFEALYQKVVDDYMPEPVKVVDLNLNNLSMTGNGTNKPAIPQAEASPVNIGSASYPSSSHNSDNVDNTTNAYKNHTVLQVVHQPINTPNTTTLQTQSQPQTPITSDIALRKYDATRQVGVPATMVEFGGYKKPVCRLALSNDGRRFYLNEVGSSCTKLTNSKGVKIICNANKSVCKTEDELRAFVAVNRGNYVQPQYNSKSYYTESNKVTDKNLKHSHGKYNNKAKQSSKRYATQYKKSPKVKQLPYKILKIRPLQVVKGMYIVDVKAGGKRRRFNLFCPTNEIKEITRKPYVKRNINVEKRLLHSDSRMILDIFRKVCKRKAKAESLDELLGIKH